MLAVDDHRPRDLFRSKEDYVAACKFTAARTIEKSDLPVTCKLQEHPGNLTIALAELFDSGGTPTVLTLSGDGLSFVIPSSIAAGDWTLAVRVQGGPDPIPSIHVVEDCDASQRILTITDATSKAAIQDIKVHG